MVKSEIPANKSLAYDRIAQDFDNLIDPFDLSRRVEVLVDTFLSQKIVDKNTLDMGCGTGHFTIAMSAYKPRNLTSVDISPKLIAITKKKIPQSNCIADSLENFCTQNKNIFDIVLSSEVIEHTENPLAAINYLASTVKPGGYLALSCPNFFWKWLLHLANFLGIRKHYQGHENWITPFELLRTLERADLKIIRKQGIHLVPWQLFPKPLLRILDKVTSAFNFYFSVNLSILAQKK